MHNFKGPLNWRLTDPQCAGEAQSPINIESSTTEVKPAMLHMGYFNKDVKRIKVISIT